MNNTCPVCFFQPLPWPPEDHNVCICCGTEFGFHDFESTFDQLRERWIQTGMRWFSSEFPPPPSWNPSKQVGFASLATTNRETT